MNVGVGQFSATYQTVIIVTDEKICTILTYLNFFMLYNHAYYQKSYIHIRYMQFHPMPLARVAKLFSTTCTFE